MHAISGYIDGNAVIANESISSYEGCNVIITILDTTRNKQSENQITDDYKRSIARNLAGLWKDHDNGATVEETVRTMRKGRSFDY